MKKSDSDKKLLEAELFEAFTKLETPSEAEGFLKDLCTPAEVEAFADRWCVAQMLVKEMPYRTIAEKTGVSVTTIGRVARFLFNGNDGYKTVLKRLKKL